MIHAVCAGVREGSGELIFPRLIAMPSRFELDNRRRSPDITGRSILAATPAIASSGSVNGTDHRTCQLLSALKHVTVDRARLGGQLGLLVHVRRLHTRVPALPSASSEAPSPKTEP